MIRSNIKYIIIYCSATREGQPYPPELLDRDHRERGYSSAGYHYYILMDGRVVTFRGEAELGAHTRGYNRESIGVCYEGGLSLGGIPKDTRTPEQKRALEHLLWKLKTRYPKAEIVGHRDLCRYKACPSFDARSEYRELSRLQPKARRKRGPLHEREEEYAYR